MLFQMSNVYKSVFIIELVSRPIAVSKFTSKHSHINNLDKNVFLALDVGDGKFLQKVCVTKSVVHAITSVAICICMHTCNDPKLTWLMARVRASIFSTFMFCI